MEKKGIISTKYNRIIVLYLFVNGMYSYGIINEYIFKIFLATSNAIQLIILHLHVMRSNSNLSQADMRPIYCLQSFSRRRYRTSICTIPIPTYSDDGTGGHAYSNGWIAHCYFSAVTKLCLRART